MELFEESLGLVDHLYQIRKSFMPEDDEGSMTDHSPLEKALWDLVQDKQVAVKVLERLAHDARFLREQSANLFNNEIVIWREPGGAFSLRMFIWSPETDDFIHDHNSFGMIICWFGKLAIDNFMCVNKDAPEENAGLQFKSRQILEVGQTSLVRPYNEDGIHRVSCAEGDIALSLSVYGRRISARDYILRYDLERKKAARVYHRSWKRKAWAKQMLEKFAP